MDSTNTAWYEWAFFAVVALCYSEYGVVQMWGGMKTFWLIFFAQKDWYFSLQH